MKNIYNMKNIYLHKNCDLAITYIQINFIYFYLKTRIKDILIWYKINCAYNKKYIQYNKKYKIINYFIYVYIHKTI